MATAYHVHGPAQVQVDFGTGLQLLGITRDGVNIRIHRKKRPIHSDAQGPDVPVELQAMGAEADIDFDLMTWDVDVLADLLQAVMAGGASEGTIGPPGELVATGSHTFVLYLPSDLEQPWTFFTCTIRNPDQIKVGTVAEPQRLSIYAWPFVAGNLTTGEAAQLYVRATPS